MSLLGLRVGRALGLDHSFDSEQRRMVETAFTFTSSNRIPGDYLEFGVFRGRTFVNAWRAAQRRNQRAMHFYAFDSFSGLPDPDLSPADKDGAFFKGQFSSDRSAFERNMERSGVDPDSVTVVEGFYDESLREASHADLGLQAAAIVWIDCDLYMSTVLALDYVTDLLTDGSLLVFDDWHCFGSRPDRGEQMACAEWLERNPAIRLAHYRDFHWAGRSFVVHFEGSGELPDHG